MTTTQEDPWLALSSEDIERLVIGTIAESEDPAATADYFEYQFDEFTLTYVPAGATTVAQQFADFGRPQLLRLISYGSAEEQSLAETELQRRNDELRRQRAEREEAQAKQHNVGEILGEILPDGTFIPKQPAYVPKRIREAREAQEFHATRLDNLRGSRVDWSKWTDGVGDADWLIEPIIATGRGHALYATAKAGKSFVVLQAIAAACVPGRTSWAEPTDEPITVLYLDYEMTDADVFERLEGWGYSKADDLSRLYYMHVWQFGDLDTPEGGRLIGDYAQEIGADLVVVDTMSRAVEGDENSADTAQAFYRYTGGRLKDVGIALLRLDHAGKDAGKGQRGSSAKNDDVDVVWGLTRTDDGVALKLTHARMGWIPQQIPLRFDPDTQQHSRSLGGYPAGTSEKATEWRAAGLSPDASRSDIKAAGLKIRTAMIAPVRRFLRQSDQGSDILGIVPGTAGNTGTRPREQNTVSPGDPIGGTREQVVVPERGTEGHSVDLPILDAAAIRDALADDHGDLVADPSNTTETEQR